MSSDHYVPATGRGRVLSSDEPRPLKIGSPLRACIYFPLESRHRKFTCRSALTMTWGNASLLLRLHCRRAGRISGKAASANSSATCQTSCLFRVDTESRFFSMSTGLLWIVCFVWDAVRLAVLDSNYFRNRQMGSRQRISYHEAGVAPGVSAYRWLMKLVL